MNGLRTVPVRLGIALSFGVLVGLVKGDETGLRAGIGNLSAPWVIVPMFAGAVSATARRGAVVGLVGAVTALIGFYAALAASALAGQLGGGSFAAEATALVRANRIYFVFAALVGPVAGALGACLARRRREELWLAASAFAAFEVVVVAAVHGRQLLPRPLYFAWAVPSWTPYLLQGAIGVAVAASVLWRARRTA